MAAVGCARVEPVPLDSGRVLDDLRWTTLEAALGRGQGTAGPFDPSDGLTVGEAVSVALILNPDLGLARSEAGIAEAQLLSAGLFPDPEVDAGWVRLGGETQIGIALLQSLSHLWERPVRRERARLRLEEVHHRIAAAEWDLAHAVRSGWAGLLAAGESTGFAEEALRLKGRLLRIMEDRLSLGAVAEMEANLARMDHAEAQRRLRRAQGEETWAWQAINRLLGVGPDVRFDLQAGTNPWEVRAVEFPIERLEDAAVSHRPDLAGLRAAYEQAEMAVQLAARGRAPRLRAGPSYEREGGDESAGAAASVEIPLWNRNRGEVAEMLARRETAEREFRLALADVRSELAFVLADLERLGAEVRYYEEDVLPRLGRNAEILEAALLAGKFDVSALLHLQNRLLEAREDAVGARLRYRQAANRLETLVGVPLPELGPAVREEGWS